MGYEFLVEEGVFGVELDRGCLEFWVWGGEIGDWDGEGRVIGGLVYEREELGCF